MLAYLVSVTGIVAALGISFFVFFSAPDQQPAMPTHATAMVAGPSAIETATAGAKPEAKIKQIDKYTVPGTANAQAAPVTTIAIGARQEPPISAARLRRLVEKERAKRLAFREGADFETRFLHYED